MGYLSDWARNAFETTRDKNAFYCEFGKRVEPGVTLKLDNTATPEDVLALIPD